MTRPDLTEAADEVWAGAQERAEHLRQSGQLGARPDLVAAEMVNAACYDLTPDEQREVNSLVVDRFVVHLAGPRTGPLN